MHGTVHLVPFLAQGIPHPKLPKYAAYVTCSMLGTAFQYAKYWITAQFFYNKNSLSMSKTRVG